MAGTHLVVTASHNKPEYKLPWLLLDKKRYEAEIAWYLVTPNIMMSPDEYDLHKGGVKYFHDNISRDEAEARLRQRGEVGSFLLRVGSNKQHVISMASKDGIMHIEVKVGPKGGRCLGKGAKEFPDIPQMMMAMYGRPIEGFPGEFLVPVPPSSKSLAQDPEFAKPAKEKKEKKDKEKKKKKKKKQKEVRKIALADLNTHELRSLLDAHGITYHHVNSRADLEALCNGLEVKGPAIGTPLTSGSSLASMKSGTSIDTVASNDSGAVSPGPSLLPPSTADLLPPAPSSLLPPSAKASTKDSGGGGMNLFNKYKAKAGSPVGGGLLAPAPPRGRSSSARMAREDSKPSAPTQTAKSTDDIQISSPKPPANDATSEASNGESKRLSEMAADFFGGLFAEANGGDGPASPGPVLASVAEAPQTASQPARIETGDTTDDSDDSGSDTTDSDDDDDSSDDSDDGNSRAHSTEFMKKLASGPPAGRPPPPANSAAAERAAKRKEKLRAMAQGL